MDNKTEDLDLFKQAVSEIWSRDGQNTWPIEINSIIHLFMDTFVEELFSDIHHLKAIGRQEKQISAHFKTASRILRLIMPCVLGMKISRTSITEIRQRVNYLLTLAKYLKFSDLANREGKNLIYPPQEFEAQIKQKKMIPADRSNSLLVHRLCAIMWNYAESVCFKLHGLIRQFHGPYQWNNSPENILIRDIIQLQPLELWEESRIIPYQQLRVITAYQKLPFTIDIYDNVTISNESTYIGTLSSYYVEADGKVLEIEEIQHICNVLAEVMINITGTVDEMNWKQQAKKYADIFWYSKKSLSQEAGRDWHYPPIIAEQIERGEISNRLQNLDPQALQRMLRISF